MNANQFRVEVVPLYRTLYAAAYAITKNTDSAKDIVQETMTKLWKHRETLTQVDNLQAFAYTVMRRTAVDVLRVEAKRYEPPEGFSAEPSTELETSVDIQAVEMLMERLPENYQVVLRLRAYDDRPIDEIARIMGITQDNVRQILARARRKLKEQYKAYITR